MLKAKTAYAYNAGSEWEENGIEYYHTFFRKYDAQIGRFTGVDIASEEYAGLTPFQFGANNPVLFNDPFGDRLASLNTNGDIGVDSHLQDLGNDLSWERYNYEDEWGWVKGVIGEMENMGRGAEFWNNLLNSFSDGIDAGPKDAFITDLTGYILNKGSTNSVFMLNKDGSFNYIGSLGGILHIDDLMTNLLTVNTVIAITIGSTSPALFYEVVKSNGEWDYKNNTKHIIGYAHKVYDKRNNHGSTCFSYLEMTMSAMDLGNLHYGVVGLAAGFTQKQLRRAAGLAQIKDGTSNPEWQTPEMLKKYFGDDPIDQFWIGEGFKLYDRYFKSIQRFKIPNWMSWLYRF